MVLINGFNTFKLCLLLLGYIYVVLYIKQLEFVVVTHGSHLIGFKLKSFRILVKLYLYAQVILFFILEIILFH